MKKPAATRQKEKTEISSPRICLNCGSQELSEVINIHRQQVASLVAKPIENAAVAQIFLYVVLSVVVFAFT